MIGLMSFAAILFRIGLRFSFFQTGFFTILWLALIVALWQRQDWARIALVVLIAWSLINLAITFIRIAGMNGPMWGLSIAVGENILRIIAALLVFRPQSNAWFKSASQPPSAPDRA
jgi:xanthosine utilization system XapX-like protein